MEEIQGRLIIMRKVEIMLTDAKRKKTKNKKNKNEEAKTDYERNFEDYTMESNETLIMPARGWRRTHKRTNFGLENREENDKKKKKKIFLEVSRHQQKESLSK